MPKSKVLVHAFVLVLMTTLSSSFVDAGVRKAIPPPDYTEEQLFEWRIGLVAHYAKKCGLNAEAKLIREAVRVSPYATKGFTRASGGEIRGCGKVGAVVTQVVEGIDKIVSHMVNKYGCAGSSCTSSGVSNQASKLEIRNACREALIRVGDKPYWSGLDQSREAISMAKKWGYTPARCAAFLEQSDSTLSD